MRNKSTARCSGQRPDSPGCACSVWPYHEIERPQPVRRFRPWKHYPRRAVRPVARRGFPFAKLPRGVPGSAHDCRSVLQSSTEDYPTCHIPRYLKKVYVPNGSPTKSAIINEPITTPAAPKYLPRISVEQAINTALKTELSRNFSCL